MNRPHCNPSPLIQRQPQTVAIVTGSEAYPAIYGVSRFYPMQNGTLVYADVDGLPSAGNKCSQEFFGFHIHAGESCTGNAADPFADARAHFNPEGKSISVFLTNRFTVSVVIGKAIIIHGKSDDFTTQPSGNAGQKIACGIIRPVQRR